MFAKVAKKLVKDIEEGGSLIPVQCLDNSNKLQPLALVFKRKPFIFLGSKYRPTGFTLNDLLKNNDSIHPEVDEEVFLDYAGMFEDKFSASVDGGATVAGLGLKAGLQGEGSSEVQSNIGTLHKQEVNMASLVRESKYKYLEEGHPLLRQLEQCWNTRLGFVSACVFNTNEFFINKEEEKSGSCKGNVNAYKVSMDHSGSFGIGNKVKLRIPAKTTLAYRFVELKINHLRPAIQIVKLCGSRGGAGLGASTFPEPESGVTMEIVGPDATTDETPINAFSSGELRALAGQLSPLGNGPVDTLTALLQLLTDIMIDQEALHTLETAVDSVRMGLTPDLESVEQESVKTQITSVLQLLPLGQFHPLVNATHLLITALNEMSYEALSALSSCCSPSVLQALHQMMLVLDEEECAPLGPVLEQEDVYQHVESLFAASGVHLQREAGSVKINEKSFPVYPLGVAVTGLAVLVGSE